MMGEWSDLPQDILGLIVRCLHFLPDYQRFASVCRSWNACAVDNRHHILHHQPPLLIFPYDEVTKTCDFVSPFESNVYKLRLPELSGKWCCGTSFGWLVVIDDHLDIQLLNPFSRAQVQLPPHPVFANVESYTYLRYWKDIFVFKAVLSSSPLSSDCIVMAIVSDLGKLSFCRVGSGKWTTLETHYHFRDIIWYKERIYTTHHAEFAMVYDAMAGQAVEQINFPRRRAGRRVATTKYLVESCGELLCVMRYLREVRSRRKGVKKLWSRDRTCTLYYKTLGFDVFRLACEAEERRSWIKLDSIGDRCLFLGCNQSLSLSVHGFPACRANCIYFTHDSANVYSVNEYGYHDVGVYRLEKDAVEPFDFDVPFLRRTALWITQDPR